MEPPCNGKKFGPFDVPLQAGFTVSEVILVFLQLIFPPYSFQPIPMKVGRP
jgi:hypothetical protein